MKISIVVLAVLLAAFSAEAKKWEGIRPSPHKKSAFARYMVRNADWGIISASSAIYHQAFGTLVSFADGPVGGSTGTPYFYIAEMSTTWKNLQHDNTISFTFSEAQSDYCVLNDFDPMDPPCARIMLTGKAVVVTEKKELELAQNALFTRHPAMKKWPGQHGWRFMKLVLTGVNLLSWYGGISHVKVDDYYNTKNEETAIVPSLVPAQKWSGRPSPHKKPSFARYMVRNGDYGIVSASSGIYNQAFGTLVSFADGSTGTPYFYIAEMSTTWKNIQHDSTISFTFSEAQSDYCELHDLDPMDPPCARIMLTGKAMKVTDEKELAFAENVLFTKHPAMKKWPKGHGWHFMALRLTSVNLLSWYGGISHVKVNDYYDSQ